MYKSALYLSLLLSTSATVLAEPFYEIKQNKTNNEATGAGVGLVAGAIAGGPLGAIIGGSMGVMIGNQETKADTIDASQVDMQIAHRSQMIQLANSYQLDIYFTTNSSVVEHQGQSGLAKLAELLKDNPSIYAELEAYSDWRGTHDSNYILADKRLEAVSQLLKQGGCNTEQLLSTSYGEDAGNNDGSWGEELFYDRRVTVTLRYFE